MEKKLTAPRFLLGGAVTFALSYGFYLGTLLVAPPSVAYSVSYGFGLIVSLAINSLFVFRSSLRTLGVVQFSIAHAVTYLTGLLAVSVFVGAFPACPKLAPLAALAISAPVSFLLVRRVFSGSQKTPKH